MIQISTLWTPWGDDDTTLDDDPDAPVFRNTSELVDAARRSGKNWRRYKYCFK